MFFHKARRYFQSLSWDEDSDYSSLPIFTTSELESLPLKWLKYLLLARVGLVTESNLERDISRFSPSEVSAIEQKCRHILITQPTTNRGIMIVLKAVYFDQAGQLPNYRVYSFEDIRPAVNFVSFYANKVSEIWICTSSVSSSGGNFAGRVSFPYKSPRASILEVVWYTSPRKIEDFGTEGFNYPFLSAQRAHPSLQLTVSNLHIPYNFRSEASFEEQLLTDVQFVASCLYSRREKIHLLQDILFASGARELSLEFKVDDGRFNVIDWDTEIETAGVNLSV